MAKSDEMHRHEIRWVILPKSGYVILTSRWGERVSEELSTPSSCFNPLWRLLISLTRSCTRLTDMIYKLNTAELVNSRVK